MKQIHVFVFAIFEIVAASSVMVKFVCIDKKCQFNGIEQHELEEVLRTKFESEEIMEITFRNSKFETFPSLVLEEFPDLQFCSLNNSQLKFLSRESFKSAEKLRTLILSHNSLTQLDENLFRNLKSLEKIDFSHNQIKFIDDKAFDANGGKLKWIDLSFNHMKIFKEDFIVKMSGNFGNIHKLNLEENQIVEIVKAHSESRKILIDILNLAGNKLKGFELSKVGISSNLNLNRNEIKNLMLLEPDHVSVNENKLKKVVIGPKIVFMRADNNEISQVQCENCSLKHGFFSRNAEGSNIMKSLWNCSGLITLDLSQTLIKSLTKTSLAKFSALRSLKLDLNQITFIADGVFTNQINLQYLNVSNNFLTSISAFSLSSLKQIKVLDVSGNRILRFQGHKSISETLPTLKFVGVFDNNFDSDYFWKLLQSLKNQSVRIMKLDGSEAYPDLSNSSFDTSTFQITTEDETLVESIEMSAKVTEITKELFEETSKAFTNQKSTNLIQNISSFLRIENNSNFLLFLSILNLIFLVALLFLPFYFARQMRKFRSSLMFDLQQRGKFAMFQGNSITTLLELENNI